MKTMQSQKEKFLEQQLATARKNLTIYELEVAKLKEMCRVENKELQNDEERSRQ